LTSISFKQYKLLRKLYKSKPDSVQLDIENTEFKFLYDTKLIDSEQEIISYISEFPFFGPNGKCTITNEGESIYNSFRIECHRHWQGIFIPQTLNVIVSVITTVVTFFILQYLNK